MRTPIASLVRTLAATSLVALLLLALLARPRVAIEPVRSSHIELDEPADDRDPANAPSSERSSQ